MIYFIARLNPFLLRVGIPIALRVIYARHFVRGPFHLGPFSYPVAVAAVLWIGFISIAFILPNANPVDSQTLNYAVVAVGIVLTYSMGFWILSARKWFTGPIKQIMGKSPMLMIIAPDGLLWHIDASNQSASADTNTELERVEDSQQEKIRTMNEVDVRDVDRTVD